MEFKPQRGPDADKRPPSIADFHKAMENVPVVPTDFNQQTVHPLALERIMAERNKAVLCEDPITEPAPSEVIPQDDPEALAAQITAENAVIAETTFPKQEIE
jgi:hypothetical protein